jgi:Helix-turn-helix domain
VIITLTLADDQLEEIAQRVAEILAAREPTSPTPDLLTVAQAAEVAGVSPKTIANWLSGGRLTRCGAPRSPLVDRAELQAFLDPEGRRQTRTVRRTRPGKPRPASGAFAQLAKGD